MVVVVSVHVRSDCTFSSLSEVDVDVDEDEDVHEGEEGW